MATQQENQKGAFPAYFGTVQIREKQKDGTFKYQNVGVLTLWVRENANGNQPIIGGYLDKKEKQKDGTFKVVDRKYVSLWDKPAGATQ